MSTFSTQIIKDSNSQSIIKLTGEFDSSINEDNPNRIDVSSLSNAFNTYGLKLAEGGAELPFYSVYIRNIWFSCNNGVRAILYCNNPNKDVIFGLNGTGVYGDEPTAVSISNYANLTNGDIGLKTLNASVNSSYCIILNLRKSAMTYNMGQLEDGQAFNYLPKAYEDILYSETGIDLYTELLMQINIPTFR